MKRLIILITLIALSAPAQVQIGWRKLHAVGEPEPTQEQLDAQREKKLAFDRTRYTPKDPWRIVGGVHQLASGTNWLEFVGTILEVHNGGIRVRGDYSLPLEDKGEGEKEFFVANWPYPAAENDHISTNYVAKEAGLYTYTTVMSGKRTIHKLDYGQISSPPVPRPLTAEEIAAAKERAAKARIETEAKTLAWHKELAGKGDAYGQLKMGLRYLNGDGVKVDMDKARELLGLSSAQGNKDATDELKKLPH